MESTRYHIKGKYQPKELARKILKLQEKADKLTKEAIALLNDVDRLTRQMKGIGKLLIVDGKAYKIERIGLESEAMYRLSYDSCVAVL